MTPQFSDDFRSGAQAEAAAASWSHPVDAIEPLPAADAGYLQILGSLKDKPEVAELFLRLVVVCLPPRSYGEGRVWKAGYHRMCALVYRLAPELYQGMTVNRLAATLGIHRLTFLKQLKYVDRLLAQRSPANSPSARAPEVEPNDD